MKIGRAVRSAPWGLKKVIAITHLPDGAETSVESVRSLLPHITQDDLISIEIVEVGSDSVSDFRRMVYDPMWSGGSRGRRIVVMPCLEYWRGVMRAEVTKDETESVLVLAARDGEWPRVEAVFGWTKALSERDPHEMAKAMSRWADDEDLELMVATGHASQLRLLTLGVYLTPDLLSEGILLELIATTRFEVESILDPDN